MDAALLNRAAGPQDTQCVVGLDRKTTKKKAWSIQKGISSGWRRRSASTGSSLANIRTISSFEHDGWVYLCRRFFRVRELRVLGVVAASRILVGATLAARVIGHTLRGQIEAPGEGVTAREYNGHGQLPGPGLQNERESISPDIASQRFVRGTSAAAQSEKKSPCGRYISHLNCVENLTLA